MTREPHATGVTQPAEPGFARHEPPPARRMRIGRISYVNMAPIFFGLDADVEEVPGVPTELNERLLRGEIDLARRNDRDRHRHRHHLRSSL